MFPNFNPAKLKPRQSPPIQEYSVFRVFATTELLEGILLQLPLHDMLRSQQVKKTFRATVQKSVEIKRALFLSSTESIEPAANPLTNPFFIQKAAELIPNVRGVDFKFRFPRDPNAEGESGKARRAASIRVVYGGSLLNYGWLVEKYVDYETRLRHRSDIRRSV